MKKFASKIHESLYNALNALVIAEELIRGTDCDKYTLGGNCLDIRYGVCLYTLEAGESNFLFRCCCEAYAREMGTEPSYPVPAGKALTKRYIERAGRAVTEHEFAYHSASIGETWRRGEYAQNRWDFIHWCCDALSTGDI